MLNYESANKWLDADLSLHHVTRQAALMATVNGQLMYNQNRDRYDTINISLIKALQYRLHSLVLANTDIQGTRIANVELGFENTSLALNVWIGE